MEKMSKEALARKRAAVILKVRSGQMTATAGAKELGISRKSYYAWERRALEALMETLDIQQLMMEMQLENKKKQKQKKRKRS